MDGSYRESLSRSRRRLQNPYAHIEDLDAENQTATLNTADQTLDDRVHASRRLLENQYAYVADGGFSASVPESAVPSDRAEADLDKSPLLDKPNGSSLRAERVRTVEIETKAQAVHKLLWTRRDKDVVKARGFDPTHLLDPAAALELLGYECELAETLGQFRKGEQLIEVAGLIDTNRRVVKASRQFSPSVRRFTLAHELGHAVLHSEMGTVHRDKPLDGPSSASDRIEREADRFATIFLMPQKLVRQHFRGRFLCTKFVISDATLFAIGGDEEQRLRRKSDRRTVSIIVAGLSRFDGRHFHSLADQFGVSVLAMAIRLEELDLT